MKNIITRLISSTLMFSTLSMSIWVSSAQATLITSEQLASNQASQQDRDRVHAFFERDDVQAQLQSRGVNSESAKARVDAMTDIEITSINNQLDNLPAGGNAVIGLLLTVFIVLLITDILGFTKVFPFTKQIKLK